MTDSALCFEVLTIFPELVDSFVDAGLLGKGIAKGLIEVHATNIRDFVEGPYRSVDDSPFGGGAGMVMKAEPVARAIESVEQARGRSHRVLVTPSAPPFTQRAAQSLAAKEHISILCGRYEGIDDRIRETMVDEAFSLGDFVLNGGEVAALAIIEAVSRLREGVLGNPDSIAHESFADEASLLEHPHYTRPETWRGREVPAVLRSGDHGRIETWRRRMALVRSWALRPELRPSLRRTADAPTFIALLLDKRTDRSRLVLDPRPEGLELLLVGGRGRPEGKTRVFRDAREMRAFLRKQSGEPILLGFEPNPSDPGAKGEPSMPAPALLEDLCSEDPRAAARPWVFVVPSEQGPKGPAVNAWLGAGAVEAAKGKKDPPEAIYRLAKSPTLIDISQPLGPQMGAYAAALLAALAPLRASEP